jgi:riboflavin transporter FmnP
MGVLLLLHLAFTYLPFMNIFFGTVPIKAASWLFPLLGGLLVFLIVEVEKLITNKN